jgi:hypothetical protein
VGGRLCRSRLHCSDDMSCSSQPSPLFSYLLGTTFQIHKEEAVCQKLVRSLAMPAERLAVKN